MSEIKATSLDILAVARQATDFDDAAKAVYLELLRDITDDSIRDACRSLALKPKDDFNTTMPSVGDIRHEVGQLAFRREQRLALPPRSTRFNEQHGRWRNLARDGAAAIDAKRAGNAWTLDAGAHEDGKLFIHDDAHGPRFRCDSCNDTGWIDERCHGSPHNSCGQPLCYPHWFAMACTCDARARGRKVA
jgi:hypothetical protein